MNVLLWLPAVCHMGSASPIVLHDSALSAAPARVVDSARVDTAMSVIRWKGTKFRGRGAHAGTIRLRNGTLLMDGMRLISARFVIDMRSIAISDIPLADATPRTRLLTHLLADDFFAVTRYPTAEYVVDRASHLGAYVYRLHGRLTMRGVTKPLAIDINVWSFEPNALRATARLSINRMLWGVAFRGSRLTNDLVDDHIQLELDIGARVTPRSSSVRTSARVTPEGES